MDLKHILFFVLAVSSTELMAQNHPIEEQIFNRISGLGFSSDGKPVVFQNNTDYGILILNPDTFEIEQELARSGNGPGETTYLLATGFNQESNEACFIGMRKQLNCFDMSGELTKEILLADISFINFAKNRTFWIDRNNLVLPAEFILNPNSPPDSVTVAHIFKLANTENPLEFNIPFEALELDYLDELEVLDNIFIQSLALPLNKRHTLIVLKGIPLFFIFDNQTQELVYKTDIESKYQSKFEISTRPEFQSEGIRTPANAVNLQKLAPDQFLLSYGNVHQPIPRSYSIFEFDLTQNDFKIDLKRDVQLENLPDDLSEPVITVHEDELFIFNNYSFQAFEIVVQSVK